MAVLSMYHFAHAFYQSVGVPPGSAGPEHPSKNIPMFEQERSDSSEFVQDGFLVLP
jgi:hypothetical protein